MDIPDLHLRPRLRASGYSDDEIRRLLRSGGLSAVRRGTYVSGAPPQDATARHALDVHAAAAALSDDTVVSHVSAAVLHGIDTWAVPLGRVHATRDRRTGGRRDDRLHLHSAALSADELTTVGGLAVTSVARTVADLARTVPFEQAVVIADAALRGGLVDRAALDAALARAGRWPGRPAARRAIGFADSSSGRDPAAGLVGGEEQHDGRSESVGESRSQVAIARAGLPAPVLQWEVVDRDGRWLGRVDFAWPELRTIGEFDGRVKYGRLLRPGQEPGDAVFAEKLREDALRAVPLSVTRWTWK